MLCMVYRDRQWVRIQHKQRETLSDMRFKESTPDLPSSLAVLPPSVVVVVVVGRNPASSRTLVGISPW